MTKLPPLLPPYNPSDTRAMTTTTKPLPPNNSEISPIKAAYFLTTSTGTAGQLGMTLCPGRKGTSPTGIYNRDLRADMIRLRNEEKCDVLVCTIQEHEFHDMKIEEYFELADSLGIKVLWYPILDGSTPKSMGKTRKLIHEVVQLLRYGKNVVIHCKAGLGRTGTLAACTLVRLGYKAEDAISLTRETRHRTIEHIHQENFVRRFGGQHPTYAAGKAQPTYKGTEVPTMKTDYRDSFKSNYGTREFDFDPAPAFPPSKGRW